MLALLLVWVVARPFASWRKSSLAHVAFFRSSIFARLDKILAIPGAVLQAVCLELFIDSLQQLCAVLAQFFSCWVLVNFFQMLST